MIGLVTSTLFSVELFARAFGGPFADKAYSISPTLDGGFVIAGWTNSFGSERDLLVIKLSGSGDLQWRKTFRGFDDYPSSSCIVQTQDGGYAIAGYTSIYGAGYDDALILKLAPDGSQQWSRTYGGSDWDWAFSIDNTTDDGFVVGGFAWSGGGFYILKISNNGSFSWVRSFVLSGYYDGTLYVAQTTDGGFAAAGYTSDWGENYALFALKLTSNGALSWCKLLPSGGSVTSLSPTSDGGFVMAGATYGGIGGPDFMAIKISESGTIEWAKCFGGPGYDLATSIIQTADEGYAVVGVSESFGSGSTYDFLLLKLDPNGNLIWAKTFGGTNDDRAHAITQLPDGSLGIAGMTASFGGGWVNFLVLKTAQDGYYPNCLQDCSPVGIPFSPTVVSINPTVYTSYYPSPSSSPNLQASEPILNIHDACTPVYEDISETSNIRDEPKITCSAVPRGLLFISSVESDIKLYLSDGRLACSNRLIKGQNRINLEPGVYLWQAGAHKGKAVVR